MKSYIDISGKVLFTFKSIVKYLQQPDCFELTIKFVTEKEIQQLNKEFRGIDKVTDVLSFPAINITANELFKSSLSNSTLFKTDRDLYYLGDMAICTKRLKQQAKEFNLSAKLELKKLVIHSMLHLFGYDHIEDKDYEVMHNKEVELDKIINV